MRTNLPDHLANVFDDHKASHRIPFPAEPGKRPEMEVLEWKKPGSSTSAIWYVRQWGTLMVFGDCYEATYQWNGADPQVTLEWISGLSLGSFVEKCRASPSGRDPRIWDNRTARERMREFLADTKSLEDFGMADAPEKFEDSLDGWGALESQEAWTVWCQSCAYEVFGQDWWEFGDLAGPGLVLDPMVHLHLAGLAMAFDQLRGR